MKNDNKNEQLISYDTTNQGGRCNNFFCFPLASPIIFVPLLLNVSALISYIFSLCQEERYTDAITCCQKTLNCALLNEVSRMQILYVTGTLFWYLGNYPEAQLCYKELDILCARQIYQNACFLLPWNVLLGKMFFGLNYIPDDFLEDFAWRRDCYNFYCEDLRGTVLEICEQHEKNVHALFLKGCIFWEMKKYRDAYDCFLSVQYKSPSHPYVEGYLSECLEKLSKTSFQVNGENLLQQTLIVESAPRMLKNDKINNNNKRKLSPQEVQKIKDDLVLSPSTLKNLRKIIENSKNNASIHPKLQLNSSDKVDNNAEINAEKQNKFEKTNAKKTTNESSGFNNSMSSDETTLPTISIFHTNYQTKKIKNKKNPQAKKEKKRQEKKELIFLEEKIKEGKKQLLQEKKKKDKKEQLKQLALYKRGVQEQQEKKKKLDELTLALLWNEFIICVAGNNSDEIGKVVEKIMSIDTSLLNYSQWYYCGIIYYKSNKYLQAIKCYENAKKLVALDESSIFANYYLEILRVLGIAQTKNKKYAEAIKIFMEMYEHNKKWNLPSDNYKTIFEELCAILKIAYSTQEELESAEKLTTDIIPLQQLVNCLETLIIIGKSGNFDFASTSLSALEIVLHYLYALKDSNFIVISNEQKHNKTINENDDGKKGEIIKSFNDTNLCFENNNYQEAYLCCLRNIVAILGQSKTLESSSVQYFLLLSYKYLIACCGKLDLEEDYEILRAFQGYAEKLLNEIKEDENQEVKNNLQRLIKIFGEELNEFSEDESGEDDEQKKKETTIIHNQDQLSDTTLSTSSTNTQPESLLSTSKQDLNANNLFYNTGKGLRKNNSSKLGTIIPKITEKNNEKCPDNFFSAP